MKYDPDILLKNINYLVDERGMKMGEFEAAMDVSAGYISRTFKKENANPGIDFVAKVANFFTVRVDDILSKDFSDMSANEKKISSFLTRLIDDTWRAELNWQYETPKELNERVWFTEDEEGCSHPMFTHISKYQAGITLNRAVFISHSYENDTIINDNCYKLSMDNQAVLYIMNISKDDASDEQAVEMWMVLRDETRQFLCDDRARNGVGQKLIELYAVIKRAENCPKSSDEVDNIIDSFMNKLPFEI